MVAFLAIASYSLHKKEKGNELLHELVRRSEDHERWVNSNIVYVFNALGDFTSALRWLGIARQTNDVGLITWDVDPLFKATRTYLQQQQNAAPDYAGAEKQIIDLLTRDMPKLPYHNIEHVYDVLSAAVAIVEIEKVNEDEMKLLRLAALCHDMGFIYSSSNHEERGAQMARELLPAFALTLGQIEIIANMILATKLPQSPKTRLEKILCDADLDYLGRDDFYETGDKLLEEMKTGGVVETDREWNIMQKTFLESHRYHTDFSKANREPNKQERLQEISMKLKNRS